MDRVFYLLFLVFVALGCQQKGIQSIDANRLKDLQSEGVVVVDVRTASEYHRGHIPGVKHIDYQDQNFLKLASQLSKEEPLVLYCARGGRSSSAAKLLVKQGFQIVYDYSGGFADWKRLGEDIE